MSNNKLAKFQAALEKKGAQTGFAPIRDWLCSGNMAFNYILSGDITKGIPMSRMTFLSGQKGSGKSFLAANAMASAQKKGYTVVLIDSENSVDEEFLSKLGVDVHNNFTSIRVFSVEEATEYAKMVLDSFDADDKVFMVIDSLSNMESSQETDKFDKEGAIASTQGLKQKKMKSLCSLLNNRIGDRMMGVLMTTHVYANQEQYGEKWRVSGGDSIQFLPSIGVWCNPLPLREGSKLVGVRIKLKTYKTRYQQTGMEVEIDLPWTTGMDLYDGVLPILVEQKVITQGGAWYTVLDTKTGEEKKFQRKNLHDVIDLVIARYDEVVGSSEEIDDGEASLEGAKVQSEAVR